MARFDVTTLGSTMLRLSVPSGERLETAPHFEVRVGGTESNVMVALARMGHRTAWVSRLNDNALGRRIARAIGSHGVDVSRVVWSAEGRNEVFYVEAGASPRPTQVLYDRSHSALAAISNSDLPLEYLLDTRVLHCTGIFPALSSDCASVLAGLIRRAKAAGVTVSFDLNYRAKLWSPQQAAAALEPLLPQADLCLLTREDAAQLFGFSGEPKEIVSACRRRFGVRVCVLTLGGEGGVAWDGERYYARSGYPVDVRERLGAGDCFAAGVLCGWLENDLQRGLQYAAAMAALKLGLHGDHFVSDRAEVERLLARNQTREVGR